MNNAGVVLSTASGKLGCKTLNYLSLKYVYGSVYRLLSSINAHISVDERLDQLVTATEVQIA